MFERDLSFEHLDGPPDVLHADARSPENREDHSVRKPDERHRREARRRLQARDDRVTLNGRAAGGAALVALRPCSER